MQSRNQLSDILSEEIPDETSTRPSASESKEEDIEAVTTASVSTIEEENEESEETTTHSSGLNNVYYNCN